MTREEAMGILEYTESNVLNARLSNALKLAIEALNEERPHGEWIINPNGLSIGKGIHYAVVCSLCNWSTLFADNFCPNCGASMVKEGEAE